MEAVKHPAFTNKTELYRYMNTRLVGLLSSETDWLANLCNAAALINDLLKDINWVGFYLANGKNKLILGPFQGKPACVHLYYGKGVCGTAAETRTVQLVPDVHAFPGHVACDADSRSEIVLPIVIDDAVVAVLDIDSPILNRFDEEDQEGLEKVTITLCQYILWDQVKK
ncbi:GAF domain-containing protein [Anoxynatronum buryatiense]|uniref:GAF domain-containing protein n=1 Tax=Anoxynatronum buryatiense TaxID=489973 RepID=A0AA45WU18_9CLOT|nr:GAF domain-containing protein [Anoxynatronum buryatiense]